MIPHEKALVKRFEDRPFTILGVNSDSDRGDARRRNAEAGVTWRSFWNGPDATQGPISRRWNIRKWPTVYVLDHEGVIRHIDLHSGARTLEEGMKRLEACIEKLVEAAEEAGH